MTRSSQPIGRKPLASLLLLPLALGGCEPGLLNPAGPVAAGERTILINSLAIMLAIVVPTILATIAFAWWFRAGNTRARYRPDFTYSGQLELLVWSVPLLVVIFLAGIAWIGSHDLDPPRPLASKIKGMEVDVVSLDWKWLFVYPGQGVASVNRLVIPAGTPVTFRVTSGTVMNSFFIPRLGSQIYAMAGMETKVNLMADRPGRFRGLSAHYSGEGFANMGFAVFAVPPAQFAGWVARAKAAGPVLDGAAYGKLSNADGNIAPFTYRAVGPRFFEAAVARSVAPPKTVVDGREQRKDVR
ncbi:ubiquinol oxidase subunit II [Sphingomonas bacterium]|uniref:ubiquinol oxidase subunit II n=1 Tax=Sphingomonas bacterium TaxID=1895847 RepID=UPI00157538E5|nr:ubiquinol oxidase subunit II [Sphingomonas bacterium]